MITRDQKSVGVDQQRSEGRIRVVQVISNLEFGGAQRQVVELTNNMPPDDFDMHVCSLSDYVPLGEQLREPHRLHVVTKKWKFDATVVPRLATLLRRLKADIVHGYLFDADIAARLAGALADVPVKISSERNTDYHIKRRQLLAFKLTSKCVDLVLANSHAGAAFNSRMLGHPMSQYRVIHNGVDTRRFAPRDSRAMRAELGVDDGELLVGMFGSFKQQKNHPLLFEAAKIILQHAPHARFLLVGEMLYGGMHGSDEYCRRAHALVDELGIRERCLFVGNRSDVDKLYPACDVTVLPSLFEGTPNVVLESLASGVPVVATDVSDNRLIIPDGQVGYVVPLHDPAVLADRILAILQNPALRHSMSIAARQWAVTEFSTAALASKTAQVYREALSLKRGARAQGVS